jgi:hypothetical protein
MEVNLRLASLLILEERELFIFDAIARPLSKSKPYDERVLFFYLARLPRLWP